MRTRVTTGDVVEGATLRSHMAEYVGTMSLTPGGASGSVASMKERHVVVVVFPGVQPLDAVGPIEVFAGATRAARALGRAGGYRVSLASKGGQTIWSESGIGLQTAPLPDVRERIDTVVLAGGNGDRRRRAMTKSSSRGSDTWRPAVAG